MKKANNWTWAFGMMGCVAVLAGGCASTQAPSTQVARASCEVDAGEKAFAAKYLQPSRVQTVSRVSEKDFRARAIQPRRTVGADLYVAAEEGVSAEYLERVLSCHAQSGQALHTADPFHALSGEVQVRVSSAPAGYRIRVTGSTPEAGREIWNKASSLTKSSSLQEETMARVDAQLL